MRLQELLSRKAVNGWRFFWIVSIPMSVVMLIAMSRTDLSSAPGVSKMIAFSVRFAVPFIYLVVAASSLVILFPGAFTTWLLRNRKHIGLCFAVAMAWQGLFIFMMSYFYRDYYFEEVFYLRDELEGSTGYIFLAAMVVTSFRFGRRFLSTQQWTLLHKSGIYFLWAYPFSTYWWSLYYYENATSLDYVLYWTGFAAFTVRIVAWGKLRQQTGNRDALQYAAPTPVPFQLLGGVVVVLGLLVAATGGQWQEQVSDFLTAPHWSANLELWLPFWPFEPFLSLFIVGFGTLLMTSRFLARYREGDTNDPVAEA